MIAKETADRKEELSEAEFKAVCAHAKQSHSRKAIDNALVLAQSEPGIAITVDDLDKNPMLLNVKNGTIDLSDVSLREFRRRDLITKQIDTDYDETAACPRWNAFLERIFPDEAIRDFVQRAVGMSLAGANIEQVLFLLYGTGANGKSTFLNILARLLRDYALPLPARLLQKTKNDAVKYELADLVGVRFATAIESGSGCGLDEPLVKMLTGNDLIPAQRKYGQPFFFKPTHTIWLAANHKPRIVGQDHGIWRRILLVPFEVQIPPEEQDPELMTKLLKELPGILNWAIQGYMMWDIVGKLDPPDSVRSATADYRHDEDRLAEFIEERCEKVDTGSGQSVLLQDLYRAYEFWSLATRCKQMSSRLFSNCLEERGFKKRKTNKGQAFFDLRLKPDDPSDPLTEPFGE